MLYKGGRAHYPILLVGKQRHKVVIPATRNEAFVFSVPGLGAT